MKELGTIVSGIGAIVGLSILRGWVISIMWSWYMVPVFGLPQVNVPLAIGISLTGQLMLPNNHQKSEDIPDPVKVVVNFALLSLICLLMGYVTKFWIN